MPLIEELSVHWRLDSCLMDRGLGGYSFHHRELGVFTNMLIKLSKRHNMQGENLMPVMTAASLI